MMFAAKPANTHSRPCSKHGNRIAANSLKASDDHHQQGLGGTMSWPCQEKKEVDAFTAAALSKQWRYITNKTCCRIIINARSRNPHAMAPTKMHTQGQLMELSPTAPACLSTSKHEHGKIGVHAAPATTCCSSVSVTYAHQQTRNVLKIKSCHGSSWAWQWQQRQH